MQKDSGTDASWYIVPLCTSHNRETGRSLTLVDSIILVAANVSLTCGSVALRGWRTLEAEVIDSDQFGAIEQAVGCIPHGASTTGTDAQPGPKFHARGNHCGNTAAVG